MVAAVVWFINWATTGEVDELRIHPIAIESRIRHALYFGLGIAVVLLDT